MCMYVCLRINFCNFSQSNNFCTYLFTPWFLISVCVSFGVAETNNALRLKFIVRCIMFKSQFVLYNDKVFIA